MKTLKDEQWYVVIKADKFIIFDCILRYCLSVLYGNSDSMYVQVACLLALL